VNPLFSKTSENKFVLAFLQNKNYLEELHKIVAGRKKDHAKICYVCLSKPYAEIIEDFKNEKINCNDFFFVDTLSSLSYNLPPVKNCIFVSKPDDLSGIKKSIKKAIEKYGCQTVVFDTISTLLIYQQAHSIVRFTHEMLIDETQKTVDKVYLVLKETGVYKGENTKLINDLRLFADKVVEF